MTASQPTYHMHSMIEYLISQREDYMANMHINLRQMTWVFPWYLPFIPLSCGIIPPTITNYHPSRIIANDMLFFINHFQCTKYIVHPSTILINMGSSPQRYWNTNLNHIYTITLKNVRFKIGDVTSPLFLICPQCTTPYKCTRIIQCQSF